jgi:multicomponent Na+:H+ antiporter subunit E
MDWKEAKMSWVSHLRRYGPSFILTFIVSFAIWMVLSGKFDRFHLALGVISCILVGLLSSDLLFPPTEVKRIPRQWLAFSGYVPWLLYQVLLANLHVMYLVFHPRMMDLIDPGIIRFKSRLSNKMSLFIFANSITLTPGTVTVDVSVHGDYLVHAIDKPSGETLPGEMEERVGRMMGEIS